MATKPPSSKPKGPKKPSPQTPAGLSVVSLFAGAGGLDIAFCETGRVAELLSTDSHPVFLQTIINNLPKHFPNVRHRHLVADARQLTGTEIRGVTPGPFDLVIGGPPCDDFTSFGLKRGMGGEKGPIIFEYARLIGELKPRAFLFENVPNLRKMCSEGFAELLERLSGHGYSITHQILAASDFGAPTVRQRLFVVGFLTRAETDSYIFPSRTHGEARRGDLFSSESALLPFFTVGEALAGLPDAKSPEATKHLNHTGRFHRPETIQHMMTVPQGVAISKSYRYRPALDGLSRSLTAGVDHSTKSYLHPIYHREMSVREYARLHGFPDSWSFAGNHHNGIKQVANAVPIPLGRALATSIAKILTLNHRKLPMTECVFFRIEGDGKSSALSQAVRALSESRPNPQLRTLEISGLARIPLAPFAYWVNEGVRRLFSTLLPLEGEERTVKQGLATADDFRFVRLMWEAPAALPDDPSRSWFPFAKGGSYSPFYADVFLKVNWGRSGAEIRFFGDSNGVKPLSRPQNIPFYCRPGLTWPLRTTSGLALRAMPAGCVFGHKGPAAFTKRDSTSDLLALLALSASQPFHALVALQLAAAEAAARSYEVGVIQRTVVPAILDPLLAELALAAWTAKRSPDTANLSSHAFLLPVLAQPGSSLGEGIERWSSLLTETAAALSTVRSEIDEIAYRLYGLGEDDRRSIEKTVGSSESSEEDSTSASGEDEEDEESPAASASGPALVSELFDYVFGCAFGRWDIRYATGEGQPPELPAPFDPLPVCPPGMLQNTEGLPAEPKDVSADYPLTITWSGILVDDENRPDDILGRVREALRVIWADRADDIETEACEILDVRAKPKENLDALRVYFRDPNRFFKDHLARCSKSRRKAPIYWPLSTDSGSYTLWIYYHRLDSQTLYTCVSEFIDPKREVLGRDLEVLGRRIGTGGSTEERQQLDELTTFLTELKTLRDRLLEVAGLPYRPNLNDGVQITAAPLWKCFRHSPWQKVLKDTWKELEKGKYNWAHLALPIWPGGVVPLCAKDRSLAIAHGLEDLLWVPNLSAKKKDQLRPLKSPDDEIKELIKAGHNKKDIDRAAIDMQVAETLGLRDHLWVERPAGKWRRRLAPKEEMDAEVNSLKGR